LERHGEVCLEDDMNCLGDNDDAAYLRNLPGRTLQGEDYLIIFGVNHEATGLARYSNVSVSWIHELLGVTSRNSTFDMPGTAEAYLPHHPHADQLYALTIARDCSVVTVGAPGSCIRIPYDFPGVPEDSLPALVFRIYLEPGMEVGPAAEQLLMPRVLSVPERR